MKESLENLTGSIEHIVYLMLENRSLDNLLGWLYEDESPSNFITKPKKGEAVPSYNGLQTDNYFNPKKNGDRVPVKKITPEMGQQIPNVDPNEAFEYVKKQIANNMQGFYIDYTSTSTTDPDQIMQTYTDKSLPIINFLAKNFAVSDAYFSSIPTQTNCNRAFSLTGNSIGKYYYTGDTKVAMVDNYWEKGLRDFGDPYEFTEKTIWNVLSDNDHDSPDTDWAVFYSQTWPGIWPYEGSYCYTQDLLFPNLSGKTNHFKDISDFYKLAESGTLPKFSFLEPTWFEQELGLGHTGSDYHPPGNIGPGEALLSKLYHKLKASPKWENTLLIINFDEHGGTYDHVEPPATIAPWKDPSDGTAKPQLSPSHPFNFETLGVRVPLILVSPLIKEKTVFRSGEVAQFDHTSVIATILNYFEIPKKKWGLGSRTAKAPTFENVITLSTKDARTDIKKMPPPLQGSSDESDMLANDLHIMIGHRFLWRISEHNKIPKAKFDELCQQHLKDVKTMAQLNEAMKTIRQNLEVGSE